MESTAARSRKQQQQKEKVNLFGRLTKEETLEVRSFVISLIFHSCLLLFLALLVFKTEINKPIVIALSFNNSTEDIVETDTILSIEDLVKTDDLQDSNDALSDQQIVSDNTEYVVQVEPVLEYENIDKNSSALNEITEKDLMAEVKVEETQVSHTNANTTSDANGILSELIQTTYNGLREQNSQSRTLSRQMAGSSFAGSGYGIDKRLANAGAKSGDVQISIAWDTTDDIDLHVLFTNGNGLVDSISFMNRVGQRSGGMLDIDMNANSSMLNAAPVENVFWPKNKTPKGYFTVYVHFYRSWTGNTKVPIKIRIKCEEKISDHEIMAILGRSPQEVTRFTFPSDLVGYKF